MSTAVLEPTGTALAEPMDGKLYEVVNGLRTEKAAMSPYAGVLGSRLVRKLGSHADAHRQGEVVREVLFLVPVPGDENRKRRPDAAFVSYERWPMNLPLPHTDPWPVIPNLVAEVVSPSNPAEEVLEKMREYFQAGVQLVGVIYPMQQWIYVYTAPTQVRILTALDELDGGAVLPGFQLPLAALFGPSLQPA